MMTFKDKIRVHDKSAIAKTFGLFLLAVMFVTTYGSEYVVCTGDSISDAVNGVDTSTFDDITSSSCRMNLYNTVLVDANTGHVKLWYYMAIWCIVLVLSLLGFVVMCCNCSHIITRIYAITLFCCAGCLVFAEIVSISEGYKMWKDGTQTAFLGVPVVVDNWKAWSASKNGLNACVMIMEATIILNVAWDVWNAEYIHTEEHPQV